MGLFSTKKTITVSSVTYNLAGDEKDRPNYLKTTMVGALRDPQNRGSIAEKLSSSYRNGPGLQLRRFPEWARTSTYYSLTGIPSGGINLSRDIDTGMLAELLPRGSNQGVTVQTAEVGQADYSFWVARYMVEHHPELLESSYSADFNEELRLIGVQLPNGSIETFTAEDFDPNARYLYATYILTESNIPGPTTVGPVVPVNPGQVFPSVEGWDYVSSEVTPATPSVSLRTRTLTTYSDARPSETTDTTESKIGNNTNLIYKKTVYLGLDVAGTKTKSERHSINLAEHASTVVRTGYVYTTTQDIGGGVTKTVQTTLDGTQVIYSQEYQETVQDYTEQSWSDLQVLIYRRNSGNALYDGFFSVNVSQGDYFPFIPVRINGVTIEKNNILSGFYDHCVRATRKSMRSSYDKIVRQLSDNPNIGDIDYAYVVFGVSLGTLDDAARRYIYEFFQEVTLGQELTGDGLRNWRLQWASADAQAKVWRDWFTAQEEAESENPLHGTPQPSQPQYPGLPQSGLRVASSNHTALNYDMTITWAGIEETVGSGQFRPGARAGDTQIVALGSESFVQTSVVSGGFTQYELEPLEHTRIWWQVDKDTWKRLDIWGLRHTNMIYGGKSVDVSAHQALGDPEGSGFIIPLQEEIYKRLPLVDSTQMAGSCMYLVLNCYTVTKQKWYQTTWFKIVLIVAVIVVAVVAPYLGGPAAVGILGTSASVGAAIGFTGVAAVIAGTIANAVAAMIVSQLLTTIYTALFGDKAGAIFAMVTVIANVAAMSAGSGFSATSVLDTLSDPQMLLKLTSAVGEGYLSIVKANTQDIMKQSEALASDYTSQATQIAAKMNELFPSGSAGVIDPRSLTEVSRPMVAESPNSFLSRTLLSGSEVADMSVGMVSNFTSYSLSTELPT